MRINVVRLPGPSVIASIQVASVALSLRFIAASRVQSLGLRRRGFPSANPALHSNSKISQPTISVVAILVHCRLKVGRPGLSHQRVGHGQFKLTRGLWARLGLGLQIVPCPFRCHFRCTHTKSAYQVFPTGNLQSTYKGTPNPNPNYRPGHINLPGPPIPFLLSRGGPSSSQSTADHRPQQKKY